MDIYDNDQDLNSWEEEWNDTYYDEAWKERQQQEKEKDKWWKNDEVENNNGKGLYNRG